MGNLMRREGAVTSKQNFRGASKDLVVRSVRCIDPADKEFIESHKPRGLIEEAQLYFHRETLPNEKG
jgi:hypothetical protein